MERRTGQNRRDDEDRRRIYYSVQYTNLEAVEKLREWLQEYYASAFEINLPDDPVELRKWGKFRNQRISHETGAAIGRPLAEMVGLRESAHQSGATHSVSISNG